MALTRPKSATTCSAQACTASRSATLTRVFRQPFAIHIGERQLAALTSQAVGQGAADTRAGTSDGSYLVFERLHALTSWAVNGMALLCAGWAACLRLK